MEYQSSQHQTSLGEKGFTVHNLTPVFPDAQKQAEEKKKVEKELYEIFFKYMS